MKKLLSEISIAYMNVLMKNTEIAQKVQAKGKEGKSYAICTIKDDGTVILGETSFKFWNQLVGCQVKLPFESWALAVWDALVNLSKGNNKDALEKGLSVEIARKAQREEEYDWVVERLHECFVHVCNNKSGGASSAGGRDDKGSSMTGRTVIYGDNAQELTINVNADGFRRTIRLPDATGRAFLNFKLGVVDVEAERV